MRGRRNPTPNQAPPNLPPCKICGEQGTGFHYGVTACGACKGFFRRSLVRKESYSCIGSGNCVIGPETKRRKSCPKCRHDKCLAVGMSKEAIKTGRYSYVKKSHDIIEMIEHHFQHYVKRKQFGEGKMAAGTLEQGFEIPRKKMRTSCALEKVSEVFRHPGSEFMELSPTKSAESCQNAFHFDNINLENGASLGINNFSEMVIPEDVRLAMAEDISVSNDAVCPSINEQCVIEGVGGISPSSCMDFRHSEMLYYFDSQASQPRQLTSTPSPLSLASPLSEATTCKESLASISPPWLEFPVYSDNSYQDMSPEGRSSYGSCPDQDYDGDFETYGKQLRSNGKKDFDYREAYSTTLSTAGFDNLKHDEVIYPFPPSTSKNHGACEISTNSYEYNSYSQQNTPSQPSKRPPLHTPVSNELEQLRRLSWDDINFDDDFLSHGYDYFTDNSKASSNNKTAFPSNGNQASYHDNSSNFPHSEKENKDFISHNLGISSYWDMDNTPLRIQDGNHKAAKAKKYDQFDFTECAHVDKPCIYSEPLHSCTSYYRDRHGSDSSYASSSAGDSINSSTTTPFQHSEYDDNLNPSDNEATVLTERTTGEGLYPACTEGPSGQSVDSTISLSLSGSLTPFLSKNNVAETLNIDPAVVLGTSSTSSQTSNEPLNFLNVPSHTVNPHNDETTAVQEHALTAESFHTLMESDEHSPKSDEIFTNITSSKTETSHDDEFLERWTPFSLGDEAPRSIEQEKECDKNVRLQESDDDYKTKPLPWCEFTEGELDEVITSLKTSYQKHVVLDTNLLSDQEIAEKLQLFLDILQLREQTFGKCAPIDREDYFKILESTGIDLGGRREWAKTNAKIFNRTLQKTVRFFRSVPGFKDICHEDKTILAKSCMYEYIILSCYRGVNVEKQVILDAEHKLAFNMDFVRLVFPEMEEHVLDIFEVSRKLMDLKLSFEETLILKAISILSPDRDKLKDFDKVDRMYWRLHCCLLLSLCRRLASPWQFYARVISVVTDLRELSFKGRQLMCNFRPDIMKLTKDIQVPLYLELMFTKADAIPEAELK